MPGQRLSNAHRAIPGQVARSRFEATCVLPAPPSGYGIRLFRAPLPSAPVGVVNSLLEVVDYLKRFARKRSGSNCAPDLYCDHGDFFSSTYPLEANRDVLKCRKHYPTERVERGWII